MHLPRVLLPITLIALIGADDCPVTVGNTNSPAPSSSTGVDVGGANGAIWDVSFGQEVLVTLRTGKQVAAKQTGLTGAPIVLLDQTLDLGTLCWRADVVCPQQVLPAQTMLVQPTAAPGAFVAGFNRRGPLAALAKEPGLAGTIDGRELSLPLAVGAAAEGSCALGQASTVLATASSADSGTRASLLQGRVTVAYDGSCLNLGGGAIDPQASVELSIGFTGKRR